jgi:HEAT repeat protein
MHAKRWCSAILLLCLASAAFASPRPVAGTENIPELMAASTLVCKGEVVDAPTPTFVPSSAGMTRLTATANVRSDRCFKGAPQGSSIPVLFDGFVSGVDPSFVLRKGDYLLFFLKPQNGNFVVVDKWFGALQVSRELGPASEGADGMSLLELDLKAGLRDSNPERMLDSIRMLGNMKRLHSTTELKQLLDRFDLLLNTYVWQALLRLKDYSVLPAVAEFFVSQPEPPHELFLPRDRLFQMQFELANELSVIRDPSTLAFLEQFAITGKSSILRMDALQALRTIDSPHSAPAFLKALDDSNADNAFSAMQGLFSLAGGGPIDWVPSWKRFDEAPQFYAAKCREWWQTEGQKSAASRSLR